MWPTFFSCIVPGLSPNNPVFYSPDQNEEENHCVCEGLRLPVCLSFALLGVFMCQCVFASFAGFILLSIAPVSVCHDCILTWAIGLSAVLSQAQLKKEMMRRKRRRRRKGRKKTGLVAFNWIVNVSGGGTGLLQAGTDNRWKAGPALQGKRGERGDGWVGGGWLDGWMGGRERQNGLVHEMTRICGLCFPLYLPVPIKKQSLVCKT